MAADLRPILSQGVGEQVSAVLGTGAIAAQGLLGPGAKKKNNAEGPLLSISFSPRQ